MVDTIQDVCSYTDDLLRENVENSCVNSLLFVSDDAFALLPSVDLLAGTAVTASVVQIVQSISNDPEVNISPGRRDSLLQQVQQLNQQWQVLQILQRVYENNMQTLRNVSGIKSAANNYLRPSDTYFSNPFADLVELEQLEMAQSNSTSCDGNDIDMQTQLNQLIAGVDNNTLQQLNDLLTQQWLSLQSAQTAWKTAQSELNAVETTDSLSSNRLNNQDTTTAAYLADMGLKVLLVSVADLPL